MIRSETVERFILDFRRITDWAVPRTSRSEKAHVIPRIEDSAPFKIDHYLAEDWNLNGERIEEWPVSIRIIYNDFKGDRFETTVDLLYLAIRPTLRKNHPRRKEAIFEARRSPETISATAVNSSTAP